MCVCLYTKAGTPHLVRKTHVHGTAHVPVAPAIGAAGPHGNQDPGHSAAYSRAQRSPPLLLYDSLTLLSDLFGPLHVCARGEATTLACPSFSALHSRAWQTAASHAARPIAPVITILSLLLLLSYRTVSRTPLGFFT
jgi:hypothetical protein